MMTSTVRKIGNNMVKARRLYSSLGKCLLPIKFVIKDSLLFPKPPHGQAQNVSENPASDLTNQIDK